MNDPNDVDQQARQRKAAENPLVSYFSGKPQAPAPSPTTPPQPQPAVETTAQTPPAKKPQAAAPTTNVGGGAVAPQTQPATAQLALPPQQVQQQHAAAPTDFTNYQRYFNANADTAQRTAGEIGGRAALKSAQAAKALQDSQAQFDQAAAAGTVGAFDPGTHQEMADPNGIAAGSIYDVANNQMSSAELAAKADGTYTGLGSLGDTTNIGNAYSAALGAQQNLDALGSEPGLQALIQEQNPQGDAGTSKLSAGLVNAAGRGDFDKLKAAFNPQANLDKAVTDSGAKADAAAALSAKNADEWARQAGIKGTQEQNDQALAQQKAKAAQDGLDATTKARLSQVPTDQNQMKNPLYGVDLSNPAEVKARSDEFAKYQEAMHLTDANQVDRTFDDVNAALSPISWFAGGAGKADPIHAAGVKTYGNTGQASQTGSTSGIPIGWDRFGPAGFWVWRSMTADDWNTLNSKPPTSITGNDQQGWIRTRLQQLVEAQKK